MIATELHWWSVVRDILVDQWGLDPLTLRPDTPLFTDDVANWMDWTELAQAVAERAGSSWPIHLPTHSLLNGWDLARLLAQGDH